MNHQMSVLPAFFLIMCKPDYIHPSQQDLRGPKLSRFINFHYFKKRTKPIYFDIDLQRQLLHPTGHPQRSVSPFQNIPLFFFFLTTSHSISLAQYLLCLTHEESLCTARLLCRSLFMFRRNPPLILQCFHLVVLYCITPSMLDCCLSFSLYQSQL